MEVDLTIYFLKQFSNLFDSPISTILQVCCAVQRILALGRVVDSDLVIVPIVIQLNITN